jgi:hypothetical protein
LNGKFHKGRNNFFRWKICISFLLFNTFFLFLCAGKE